MSTLGIYFGTKSVNAVLTQGKKVLANIAIPQLSAPADDLEAKPSYEDKTIELIGLLRDAFKKNKVNVKDVNLCLSGRDLLIRTFEIPDLPREELQGVVNFEVKKYIPFKIEELNTDFQLESMRGEKTKLALFAGIKKDTLNKYNNIFSQLGMKIKGLEYAPISLLRAVKLAGLADGGVIGTIFIDSKAEDESNFLVTESGFPLFARDITLMGLSEGAAAASADGSVELMEKLKTEIRISLDYYNRKFSSKDIKKVFVISSQAHFMDLQAYLSELGITAKFIDPAKLLGSSDEFSAGAIKSFSASLSGLIRTKVDLNLLKPKSGPKAPVAPLINFKDMFKGVKFDFRINFKLVFLGALACGLVFGWGMLNKAPLNKELNEVVLERKPVEGISAKATLPELKKANDVYKSKLANLDELLKSQIYFTIPLNVIPKVLPEGMWLEKLSFVQKSGHNGDLGIEGFVYLSDSDKEVDAVNKFLTALKESADFNSSFNDVRLDFVNNANVNKYNVTRFSITCTAYGDKKAVKKGK
jgi:type IV pilus assembly protein PilM